MKHINFMIQMIEAGMVKKSDFLPILEEADKEIFQFSEKMNFVYKEGPNLFVQTTDERLAISNKKQKQALEKPEVTIQECVKKRLSILNDFIKKYHIGFIRSAEVNENGFVKLEIPCSIHSSFVDDNKQSAKATLDTQIKFLQQNGIEVMNTKNFGLKIKRTEKNMEVLEELLKSRGCTQVRFSTINDFIDKIKCMFSILNIEKFEETPIDILFETNSETLNKDEVGKILKYAKEIVFAESSIACMGENIKDTCCSLIESYFSNICKVLDFDGKITEKVNARFESERNKNVEINNIENDIGDTLSLEKIKDVLTTCKEKIDKFTVENLSCSVFDFEIDRYGFVSFSLRFTCCKWLTNYELPNEEVLKTQFEMSSGNVEEETLSFLDTYENKQKIQKLLTDFCPTSRLIGIECSVKNNEFCINKIRVVIDDISNIL